MLPFITENNSLFLLKRDQENKTCTDRSHYEKALTARKTPTTKLPFRHNWGSSEQSKNKRTSLTSHNTGTDKIKNKNKRMNERVKQCIANIETILTLVKTVATLLCILAPIQNSWNYTHWTHWGTLTYSHSTSADRQSVLKPVFKHFNNLENMFFKTRVLQAEEEKPFSRRQNDMVNYTETWVWFIRQDYENTERFFILQYGSENKNERKKNLSVQKQRTKTLGHFLLNTETVAHSNEGILAKCPCLTEFPTNSLGTLHSCQNIQIIFRQMKQKKKKRKGRKRDDLATAWLASGPRSWARAWTGAGPRRRPGPGTRGGTSLSHFFLGVMGRRGRVFCRGGRLGARSGSSSWLSAGPLPVSGQRGNCCEALAFVF